MRKVICVKCKKPMNRLNGINVAEYFDNTMTKVYKLWRADKHFCDFGAAVVSHFADAPYAQHFQEDFDAVLTATEAAHKAGECELVETY